MRARVALFTLLVAASCSAAASDEARRITAALGLGPGMHVADVGAGDGKWSQALAAAVGADGRVYATEVDPKELAKLRAIRAPSASAPIDVIAGTQEATGLAEGCCDAVLLRMVFHHFTDPPAMGAELARSLRPGARLLVIDTRPQKAWRRLEGVPDRGGHGIGPEELERDLVAAGLRVEQRFERWDGPTGQPYAVLLRRP